MEKTKEKTDEVLKQVQSEEDKEYSSEEIREMVNSQRNIVIRKDFFDVFYNNPNAENVVNALAPKKIFVYGVTTNVCVNFAVILENLILFIRFRLL